MSTENNPVLYEKRGSVALITLNRPESLNALSGNLWEGWVNALATANGDEEVGAIVVTGAGRAFSVGGDMVESFLPKLRGETPYEEDDHRLGGLGLPFDWVSILRESKPVIAAVNGIAVGGGITSILPCDMIVASQEASFGFVFVKVGIVPELCSSHYLSARVGFAKASELMLTGRVIDAGEALEIGLVNQVVEPDSLLEKALEQAAMIAQNPGPMLALTKTLIDENLHESDTSAIWRRESDALRSCFSLPEHREAVDAFLEKRRPDFAAARARAGAKD